MLLWVRKWDCGVCGEKVYYFDSCSVVECGCCRIRKNIPIGVLSKSFIKLGDEPLSRSMRKVALET